MLKFQNPKPTKSGKSVVKIWNELKENWHLYKRAKLEDDFVNMRKIAVQIKNMQEDLGIKQANFPELVEKKSRIKIIFHLILYCLDDWNSTIHFNKNFSLAIL